MTTSLVRPRGVDLPGVGGSSGAASPGATPGDAGVVGGRGGSGRSRRAGRGVVYGGSGDVAGVDHQPAEGRALGGEVLPDDAGSGHVPGVGPRADDGPGRRDADNGPGRRDAAGAGRRESDQAGPGQHGGDEAGCRGSASVADAALASAAEQVEALAEVDDAAWGGRAPRELASALRVLETMTRRVQAVTAVVSAELVAAEEHRGRSRASAVKHVARGLKLPDGVVRDRADAGARSDSPGMAALRAGRITASQEKCVAKWVGELGDGVRDEVRDGLASRLVALAEQGEPAVVIGRYAGVELDALVPGRQDDRVAAQQRNRQAHLHSVRPDGTSLLSVTCTPEMRAVLDAVVAKYAQKGRCLPAVVDPETGVPADVGGADLDSTDLDQLAAADQRTYPQRVHDAIRHLLEAGLDSRHVGGRVGVASIVIRMTPEQAEAVFAGGHGGPVVTDAGSDMSARQAVAMSDRRGWFLSALHRGRELLTPIPIDGILDRGPGSGPEGDAGPEPGGGPSPRPGPESGPGARGGPPPAPTSGKTTEKRLGTTRPGGPAASDTGASPGEPPRRGGGNEARTAAAVAALSHFATDVAHRGSDSEVEPDPPALAAWWREVSSSARGPHRGRRDPRGPRIASAAQRLVLYAAHGGCTHPGCHTPAARCQAHHVHEYRAGGRTVLVNLCLACPIHHGWIGRTAHSWRTEPDPARPGRPRWIAPPDELHGATPSVSAA